MHVVLGCGVPMVAPPPGANTQHYGSAAFYKQNAEETNDTGSAGDPGFIQVDFKAEQTAGRYRGGFISFYMITPEGSVGKTSAEKDNCGDFTVNASGHSQFGKIYFTDKDLNNDGDFVHYLVYQSKFKAKSFIFGFEDLFRGGDNDFEDMLIRVTGLTPPCVPTTEVCDGLDNDCDGVIDNAPAGVGSDCLCDSAADCDNGPKLGLCQAGTTVCTAGSLTCHSTVGPTSEVCDLKDNNCDGQVDNAPTDPTIGNACDGPDADSCKEGNIVCQNGVLTCNDNTGNNIEICNNLDDNCNGQVDEGNPGGGGACGSNVGICTQGTLNCTGGTLKCTGGVQPGTEICNGLDDNCNGIVDDSPAGIGVACGGSAVGACKQGQTICTNGTISCAGQVGPTTETCNNIDDDCDGTVDDNTVDSGQPCGSSIGACSPGHFVCITGGVLQCQGATGPTTEICNGIDDDCDGIVDEDVPGIGSDCALGGSGACSAGISECINGVPQCVGGTGSGTEVCNNIDDDCDGKIDEGSLCDNGVCDHGVCAAPCVMSEFPCPSGKKCDANNLCVDDPCFGVTCPNDMDGNEQTCQGSTCMPVCNDPNNQCTAPAVCRGRDGACVPNTCDYLPLCTAGQVCINSVCGVDPCAGVTCGTDQFCRAGTCVASCDNVQCDAAQVCQDGACVATGCPTDCPDGTVCDPTTKGCITNKCSDRFCPPNQVCDPVTDACVADQCAQITCPNHETCNFGQCGIGSHGHLVTAAGGGCDAGGGGDAGGFAAIGAVLLALVLRKRRALWLPLVASLSFASASCKLNNYCIDCETDDGGTGGSGDAGSGSGSGGSGSATCDPNAVHQETCNGADDDCDGIVDEGFDTTSDPLNCGACGVQCNKPGAQTVCSNSQCVITGCFPGFEDVDGDTTSGPYASSDGCEYKCFKSNNGVEACDNLDNDCDGKTDEGINLTDDLNNCGQCGRVCGFFSATPTCSGSVCSFNPATDCKPGFFDIDGMQQDGCEYQCTKTNGGVEKCDLIDNNCDGVVDDGFDVNTDKNNCGRCGLVCSFANASASCSGGGCLFNPATDCKPGFVDLDGMQINGCEYQCTKTNGGVEKCDGKDNDCNGVVDDMTSDAGGACSSTGTPKGVCIANGVTTCAGGHLVCSGATEATAETCNNADDDCDGQVDDNVTKACYDGSASTNGVGACHGGTSTCAAGAFGGCAGEVLPGTEICDGIDNDCNGVIDNGPGGAPITASCYSGAPGTAGVGTCKNGTKTCSFGSLGACVGEVDPTTTDVCGDGLDTNCNGKDDAAEGCLAETSELRLDGPAGNGAGSAGALGTAAGAQHSHDVVLATGGVPFGTNVYAVWNDLVGNTTEIYLRKSSNGGKTFGPIVNVTAAVSNPSVEPVVAVQPGVNPGDDDTVVIAYQNVSGGLRDILVQRSTNSGTTWSAPTASLDGATPDSFHQSIAMRGTTVVVAWEQLDPSSLNRDVVSRTSSDSGATFGAAMILNTSHTATARFAGRPQVGVTASGGAVWAWREQRSGSTRDIFAQVTPTAATPPAGNDTRIDGDTTDKRDSDFPQLKVAGEAAYLVWQDTSTVANGGSDVVFSHLPTLTGSWSTEAIIDDPTAEVSSSFTPVIAVDPKTAATGDDDIVVIAWEDRRAGTEIFTSVSKDGAKTAFSAALRASNDTGGPATGVISLPAIAASALPGSGVFVLSWQASDVAGDPSHVFSSSTIDSAASWTFSQALLDGGTGAAVKPVCAGSLFGATAAGVTAWTDFRTNGTNGDIFSVATH